MDDFNLKTLQEASNEWAIRLVNLLTPCIENGLRKIFNEAVRLCKQNNESNKYLMTFQNLLRSIKNWNQNTIDEEQKLIVETSKCNHLDTMITCVHICQLKSLTASRAGHKQKKIDIDLPSLDKFIHKVYILSARSIYKNIYLYELNISPLQTQRNNREIEQLIGTAILNAVRESVPIDTVIRAYLDNDVEIEVEEEVKEEIVEKEEDKAKEKEKENEKKQEEERQKQANFTMEEASIPVIEDVKSSGGGSGSGSGSGRLSFNDLDSVRMMDGKEHVVNVPKTIENLEEISKARHLQRKMEESSGGGDDDDEDNEKLVILDDDVPLAIMDIDEAIGGGSGSGSTSDIDVMGLDDLGIEFV